MFDWLKKEEPKISGLPPLPTGGPGLPPLPIRQGPPHKEQVELSEPHLPPPPQSHAPPGAPEDERVGWERTGEPEPPHPAGPPPQEHHPKPHEHHAPAHAHKEGPRDVFVKIEKFKDAKHALESAQSHIHDINELLKELRKINNEEQEQITHWEHNLDDIKNKVRDVADNIFDKV